MSVLHAVILGIVQGLSEFLPISSSGHLLLVPWLLDWEELSPEVKQTFDVALHVGTFVGAFAFFRNDVARLAAAGLQSIRERRVTTLDQRLAWLLVVSALPAATVGLALDLLLEGRGEAEWLIAVMLIVFGVVLWVVDRAAGDREVDEFRLRDALLMGTAQALALQPGVSRSGATISMGRWLRFDRAAATRLSFLMSLPVIAGAGAYSGIDTIAGEGLPPGFAAPFAWGMLAAAVTGFLAVWGLLRLVQHTSFLPFVAYRIAFGALVLGVALR